MRFTFILISVAKGCGTVKCPKWNFEKKKKSQADSLSVLSVSQVFLLFCCKIIVQVSQASVASCPASPQVWPSWDARSAPGLLLCAGRKTLRETQRHLTKPPRSSPPVFSPLCLLQFVSTWQQKLLKSVQYNLFSFPPFHLPAAYQRDQMWKSQNPRIRWVR